MFTDDDTCSSWSLSLTAHSAEVNLDSSIELASCTWSEAEESWPSCDWSTPDPASSPIFWEGNDDVLLTGGNNTLDKLCTPQDSPRRSPRVPKAPRIKFDPSNVVKDEIGWQLSKVLDLNGCQPRCAVAVHGLCEYDILLAHSMFASKEVTEQRMWLADYFATHCPNVNGEKDYKHMRYLLCGKVVCQNLWQAALSVSTSRFYDVRRDFLLNSVPGRKDRQMKQLAPKSMKTIEWMRSYFDRVGDKRPDKDGIYLPTCLTERLMYNLMIKEVPQSAVVCFSQFNKLYRKHFPHVSIPKVSSIYEILRCVHDKCVE